MEFYNIPGLFVYYYMLTVQIKLTASAFVYSSFASICTVDLNYYNFHQKLITSISTKSITECTIVCQSDSGCATFGYDITGTCDLLSCYSDDATDVTTHVSSSSDKKYFSFNVSK